MAEFIAEHGGLDADAARAALDGIVSVVLGPDGAIAGVGAISEVQVPMIGGARLWVHRCLLLALAADAEDSLLAAAYDALDAEHDPGAGGPIGLCQSIADRDRMRATPEAVSPRSGLLHAGFLDDGSQIRLRHFAAAAIGPRETPLEPAAQRAVPPQIDPRHRIEPLVESEVTAADVVALWGREGVVPTAEAERRISEVNLVAIDEADGVVGVSSSYLQRNRQLGMDMHYFRAFVAEAHRRSSLAFVLALRGRDHLEERYLSGQDTRAAGIVYEVESPLLKRYRNEAHWIATDFTYIGETPRGAHVRVHYFPGAKVPMSPA